MKRSPAHQLLLSLVPLASLALHSACYAVRPTPGAEDRIAVLRPADPATPERCRARRRAVAEALGDGLLVVTSGAEGEGRFRTDDDFRWLTGADVPEATLVLDVAGGTPRGTVLYLPPKDAFHETWNGPRLAPGAEATRRTGIQDTRSSEELAADLAGLAPAAQRIRYAGPDAVDLLPETEAGEARTRAGQRPQEREADPRVGEAGRLLLGGIQARKDEAELAALTAAVNITEASLADAMRVALPGAWEFTAEAVIEGGFRRRGAQDVAFPSICGSGPNTCYLHYRSNERRLAPGDLLVMDVGAKVHGYCADVTRTIPVSGAFTPRQREIYELVHEAAQRASETLRPGSTLQAAHEAAVAVFEREGLEKRFLHSVGHGLGLRVHDTPGRRTPLEPGMVVTIEPGLYLPDEEIGVRIEDDWVITEDGARLLSDAIPSGRAELEAYLSRLRRP